MKIEEYLTKLEELERTQHLPWAKYKASIAELQAEYLAGQAIPDAESAIAAIATAWYANELPELGEAPLPQWRCELLELLDEGSPDKRVWRCRAGNFAIDVHAEDGEVSLMSV